MTKYYQTDGRRVARGRVTPKEQVKRVPVASEEEGLPVWALLKSVQLSLADLAGTVKEGLLAFAVATGFEGDVHDDGRRRRSTLWPQGAS